VLKNADAITKEVLLIAQAGEGFISYTGSVKPSVREPSRKRSL
jgi:hypothetical protein